MVGLTTEEETTLRDSLVAEHFSDLHSTNAEIVDRISLIFLRFRNHDIASTVERLKSYFAWRLEMYGGLRNMSLDESPKIQSQLQSGFVRVSAGGEDGRAYIFLQLRKHDPSKYDAQDTLRCVHYVLMRTLHRHPEVAREGFSVIGDMTSITMSNLDLAVPEAIASAMQSTFPTRMRSFVIVRPPFIVRFIIPVVKLILSSKLGNRLNVVTDTSELVEKYHVPVELLPESLGGTVPDDCVSFSEMMVSENTVV